MDNKIAFVPNGSVEERIERMLMKLKIISGSLSNYKKFMIEKQLESQKQVFIKMAEYYCEDFANEYVCFKKQIQDEK